MNKVDIKSLDEAHIKLESTNTQLLESLTSKALDCFRVQAGCRAIQATMHMLQEQKIDTATLQETLSKTKSLLEDITHKTLEQLMQLNGK